MKRILLLAMLLGICPLLNADIKFRGKPAPECSTFFIFEAGGLWETGDREFGANSEIGLMFNLSRKSAVGGSVFHQLGANLSGFGLKFRYRYWLSRSFSLDIAPGILLAGEWGPTWTGHVGLNFKDWVGVFAQIDRQNGLFFRRTPVSFGIKLGSYAGIVPSIGVVLYTLLTGYQY